MRPITRSAAVVMSAFTILAMTALPAAAKTDKQVAKAASITAKDVGRGWTAKKQAADKPSGISECSVKEAADKRALKYKFESPDFQQGDARVSNSVYVFPKVKDAQAYLAAFQDPSTIDCLQLGLEAALADSAGASVTVENLDVTGDPVDDGVGFRATITIPDGAIDATLIFEAVAFRVGRGVTGLTTNNANEALPITPDLATASIKRLKRGLR